MLLPDGGRLHFTSSLLQLRGAAPTETPLRSSDGDFFLFNGAQLARNAALSNCHSVHVISVKTVHVILFLTVTLPITVLAHCLLRVFAPLADAYCSGFACPFLVSRLMRMAAERAGEVFGGLPVPADASDSATLFAALQGACRATAPPGDSVAGAATGDVSVGVPGLLSPVRGPWSLVFWAAKTEV